jgi:hypothetical protein
MNLVNRGYSKSVDFKIFDMKTFLLSILFFVGIVSAGFGQDLYVSVPSGGNWTADATWDLNGDEIDITTDGVPGPGDIAVIIGDNAGGGNVLVNANVSVGDLYIQFDNPNVLSKGGLLFSVYTLTINGQLGGFDNYTSGNFEEPTTTVIQTNQRLNIIFTGANIGSTSFNPIITSWSLSAPLRNLSFNAPSASTNLEVEDFAVFGGSNLNLNNGILTVLDGNSISQSSNATINVNSGTSLIVNGSITGDGSTTSRFNNINIQGNVTIGTSGYINSTNFTLGSASTFTINFNGANQTQGWWYQSTGPTGTFTLDPASTVIYNASANQTVGALEYGILSLRSPSAASVKALQSTGNLQVQGLLRLNSANVTFDTSPNPNPINLEGNVENLGNWSPTQRIIFSGTSAQSINGANEITFGGGVRVSNTAGLTLNNIGIDINTELDIDPSCSFNPSDQTVTMSGDFRIDGDLIAGTSPGGFVFDGTTAFLGAGTRAFYNVNIDAAGTLTGPTGTMEVKNNWTNNGVFDDNLGTVLFSNPDPISISGGSTTSFYNLTFAGANTAIVSINGPIELENIMSFTGSPNIDLDGSGSGVFTLKSTPTRDAAIGDIGTATVSGNITAERYIVRRDPTLDRGYHIVGFPATGVTVADVQNELPINGTFTGASGYVGDGSINPNNPSLYRYNESLGGALGARYSAFPPSTNTTEFTNGEGYSLFTFTGLAPLTINGRGTIKTGVFNRSLSYTGTDPDAGWHTIANPYPANTDWSLWTKNNINGNAAHIYDPQTGNYEVYDGGTAGQLIPQGQGFWVRATDAGPSSVEATEASKVTGSTPTFYRTSDNPLPRFEIILRKDTIDDVAIVSFNENATDNYEAAYDADRLLNVKETFSTLTTDGRPVKVNRLASLSNTESCSRSIFFKLEQMVNGKDYKLLFRDIDNLPSQSFVLMDHYLEQTVKVTNSTIYDFQVNSDAASKNDARFELILSSNQPSQVVTVAEDICPEQNALLTIENSQSFVNYLVLKNNKVISSVAGSGADLGIEISKDILVDDINDFVIKGFVSGCDTVSAGNAQIQVNEALTFNNVVNGSSICNVDTQAPFSLSTQVGANYNILNGTDTIQTIQGTGNNYEGFIASNELNDGLNEFVIAVEKDGCQSGTLTENLQIEVQNLTIDSSISFTSENTCLATASSISFNGQAGVEYQIYKGATLVNSITADSTEQIVNIPEANLAAGVNEFTVVAQYGDCAEYEFPNPVQIQVEESINTNLSLITENICGDANTSITIENAQAGKTYTLQSAGSNITSLTADVDGDLIFNLNSNQISTGLNELDIQIEGQICGAVLSANKAVFSVYESINSNLDYISSNVCNATEASVGISNAQAGKTYRLYKGGSLVESIQATTDGQLLFAEANNQLEVGSNTFNLQIESAGCGVVDVAETLSLTLYESINPDLSVISSDICTSDDQVTIEITNAQEGKTYELLEAGNVIATQTASSANNLMFNLVSDQFSIGNNVLNINISDANCGTTSAIQSVEFEKYDVVEITPIDTQSICLNENVTIDLSANASISSYQLFIGNELIQEVAGTSLSLAPTETTTYSLTGIPENGCSVNTINFTVEVTDLAKPGILASANVLESSIDGDRYQWYLNGEVLSGETSKVVVANQSGDYSVEVTKGSCSNLSDAFTFNEEVLNANKALLAALNLYPNPVEDKMFIELNDIYSVNVTIFTLSGKFIDSFEISSNKSEIDMSKFSKGTYLIQFESGKGSVTKRIVKL